jgi:hypothetical protein
MNNICESVKNKNELNKRCKNIAVNDCLCGIHLRSKNIILFNDIKNKVYSLKNIPPYNQSEKELIKYSLKYYQVAHSNKRDYRILYTTLLSYLTEKSINCEKSIILQKYSRRHLIKKLKSCVNQEDFYSLDHILQIPFKYIYILKEKNVNYCFDIRSLNEYFKTKDKTITNPYNNVPFSNEDLKNINLRFNKYKDDINFKIKQDILSPRQVYKQRVISVFQNYDNLGFILNIEWFSKLRFEQLKYLYRKCEDVWNYRAQLTNEQKLGIVHNGKLFTIPVITINRMRINKDKELRNILLTEFNRAVTEGTNEGNRKLGAILILTGFAEISQDVMNSYPWLSQSF